MEISKLDILMVPIGFFLMVREFRDNQVGGGGWILAAIAAVLGYEMIFLHNFGIAAMAVVIGFAIYAWRNWFVSLCATVILMAFLENRETPKTMLGIHGLNPWSLIMINVLGAWLLQRRSQGLYWDIPRKLVVLYVCFLFVIVWSFVRMTGDYHKLEILNKSEYKEGHQMDYTLVTVTSDYLINCVKWLIPAVLFYDGCRTRRRIIAAIAVILATYFVIAVQVNHAMPFAAVAEDGTTLARIASHDLDNRVGYFRTELSMMLAGASWATLCTIGLVKTRRHQLMIIAAAATMAMGQALTGGRAGYVTWGLIGIMLCFVRWRKLLPLIPVVILGICICLPGVRDRMLQGFEGGKIDTTTITSNRTAAWAHVIPYIKSSPIFGYGRAAMVRIGIYEKILAEQGAGEAFPHPHNAYLELLLDDGLVGFFLAMPIYIFSLVRSLKLMKDLSDPIYSAVGGVSASIMLGLLIAAMGSEHFYPSESSVEMWAAVALVFRVWVERERSQQTGEPLFGELTEGDESEEIESITDDSPVPA